MPAFFSCRNLGYSHYASFNQIYGGIASADLEKNAKPRHGAAPWWTYQGSKPFSLQ